MGEIHVRICGIPARAEIIDYRPGDPGCIMGPPEACYPPEDEEVDFRLLDRRGYPAPWLETKAEREGIDLH